MDTLARSGFVAILPWDGAEFHEMSFAKQKRALKRQRYLLFNKLLVEKLPISLLINGLHLFTAHKIIIAVSHRGFSILFRHSKIFRTID
jgi:hypothetical protein